jgi:glycosyltransferase involved in cell wall biosynthesis
LKSKIEPQDTKVCVVIPAFRVKSHILDVIRSIGPEVEHIIVVDDACPEKSGEYVEANNNDSRVEVVFHSVNLGVGGSVKTGYKRALELGSDIVVKIDGDGQMDTSKIMDLVEPIQSGGLNYTKGNRFFDVEAVREMPIIRIFGNLFLSFLAKLSSGYWRIFDPNNGFTAIDQKTLSKIPLEKIDSRYFFESDMLFRLNLVKATVQDVSMPAIYGDEKSNLRIMKVIFEFPFKHFRNFVKRLVYSYYLQDFNLASIELPVGIFLGSLGTILGIKSLIHGISTGIQTDTGTLVFISMSILIGVQLVLAFFNFDMTKERQNG